MIVLKEMAFERKEVIDKCFDLGSQFVDHFNKIMKEGKSSQNYSHHCHEMQAFWDKVKNLVMKPRSRRVAADELINWFFTVGSDIDSKIEEPHQDYYETLCVNLLNDRTNARVKDILDFILV